MERDLPMKLLWPVQRRHPQFFGLMSLTGACSLVVLSAILYGYDRAGWWTPLLAVGAAAGFYYAYRLQQLSNERKAGRDDS